MEMLESYRLLSLVIWTFWGATMLYAVLLTSFMETDDEDA